MRIEKDILGEVSLDENSFIGINTKRAVENFPLSGKSVQPELIKAIVIVKKACALANMKTGALPENVGQAIVSACEQILSGEHSECFVTDSLQGGAGTSTNMNVNEVIANVALANCGKSCGDYDMINPLDHVNLGQSTNDVYPTALRICSIYLLRELSQKCAMLQETLQRKEAEFAAVKKVGRTELMDAVEITLGEEFGAFAQAISRDRWRIYKIEERLRIINIGGTAVGNGDLASRQYVFKVTEILQELTGIGLARAEYPMDLTQNCDVFVEASGLLKALAVNLVKICGDLRLMNSNSIAEIALPQMQQGSTIMPGKINPVIPEAVTQAAIRAMANDFSITYAASLGNFELNAFAPLIADNLLDSLKILINAVEILDNRCVTGIIANLKGCSENMNNSSLFAVKFVPLIGYEKTAEVVFEANGDREIFKKIIIEKYGISLDEAEKLMQL